MTTDYRTKVFRSGNSNALRLPKSFGLVDGDEVVMVPHADGSFGMWKADRTRDVFMALYGSMSPGFMADGRGDIGQDARDWDGAPRADEAA